MKARPSVEKRLRELKLQERRADKTERRKLRKERPTEADTDASTLELAGQIGIPVADDISRVLAAVPAKED